LVVKKGSKKFSRTSRARSMQRFTAARI